MRSSVRLIPPCVLLLLTLCSGLATAAPPPRGMRAPARAALAPGCPSHYDALWWDGFALPVLDGEVHAFAEDGADLIVGGDFDQFAMVHTVHVARWNGSEWSAVGGGVPLPVLALTWWNGHLIAGCDSDEGPGPRVFELDGASWQPLGEMDGSVQALAVYGGDLIAAGYFSHADGESVGAVARWDGSQWQPLGSGFPEGNANALAVYGTDLVVGALIFTNFNGLARWNGSGWAALGGALGSPQIVNALLADGSNLYVSGHFTTSAGSSDAGLTYWNGAAWSKLGTSVGPGTSLALALYGGTVAASAGPKIWNGSVWNTLDDGLTGESEELFAWGGNLVETFPWGSIAGAPLVPNIVVYDGLTWESIQADWIPGIMAGIESPAGAAAYHGQLVVGGVSSAGAQDHFIGTSGVSSWDGAQWSTVGTAGLGGASVLCVTPWNDSLVVGTVTTKIGGVNAKNIARWDGSAWGPIGVGFNYWVYGVTIYDGQPVALGPMMFSGTTTVNGSARWDGSSWQPLGTGFNLLSEWPYAGAQWGSDLIVAGDFTAAGGVPASHVARWDGSAWHALGSGVDGFAEALAVFEGDLILGGLFTHAGGIPVGGVARWNGSTWSAMGPSAAEVHVLRVVDGRLFAAGEFLCADGSEVYGLAIWNGQDWVLTGSGFGPAYFTFIEPWNGDLYVGGEFGWANGHPSFNIARLMDYASVGVGPGGPIAAPRLRAPLPNPSARSAELRYELPAATRGRLVIFDVSGRRVATLAEGLLPAGPGSASWSGLDRRGRLCGAGLYFARLETALGARSVKLVRSR